mmetsp:Transcript_18372/g.55349  ORF Transcript_18372/g.55349 Transcript_18372/m.55349 type:complete len:237 (-) Transcript_18372:1534-2244(-)
MRRRHVRLSCRTSFPRSGPRPQPPAMCSRSWSSSSRTRLQQRQLLQKPPPQSASPGEWRRSCRSSAPLQKRPPPLLWQLQRVELRPSFSQSSPACLWRHGQLWRRRLPQPPPLPTPPGRASWTPRWRLQELHSRRLCQQRPQRRTLTGRPGLRKALQLRSKHRKTRCLPDKGRLRMPLEVRLRQRCRLAGRKLPQCKQRQPSRLQLHRRRSTISSSSWRPCRRLWKRWRPASGRLR